jgi:sulfoxide reductase heme-binding subunit YedZ
MLGGIAPLIWNVSLLLAGRLGADPLAEMIHASGWWAMALLLVTLSVSPLRRLSVWAARHVELRFGRRISDLNSLVRHRRQLGLWSFFYALVHVSLHAVLAAGSVEEFLLDVRERPFVMVGLVAFLLLVPLAATSSAAAMRLLQRHWARLHRLVYLAAALGVLHTWWQTKAGHPYPWGFALLTAALLGVRLWMRLERGVLAARRLNALRRLVRRRQGRLRHRAAPDVSG